MTNLYGIVVLRDSHADALGNFNNGRFLID